MIPWRLRHGLERWVESSCRDRRPGLYRWLHFGEARDRLRAVTSGPHHHFFGYYDKWWWGPERSEEHTSELQSRENLVCRLLLEASRSHRFLHSFPTRRSSDLHDPVAVAAWPGALGGVFVPRSQTRSVPLAAFRRGA